MFYRSSIPPQSLRFIRPRLGEGETDQPQADQAQKPTIPPEKTWVSNVVDTLAIPGGLFGAYTGYMNTQSIFWSVVYGVLGYSFPVFAIPIMAAQVVLKSKEPKKGKK